jgi:subtilisin family serine protease
MCDAVWPSGASGSFGPNTEKLTVGAFIDKLEGVSGKQYKWTVVGDKTLSKRDVGVRSTFVADASSASTFAYEAVFDPFPRGVAPCKAAAEKVPCLLDESIVKVQRTAPAHLLALADFSGAPSVPDRTVRFDTMGSGVIVYVIDGNVMPNDEFNDLVSGETRLLSNQGFFSDSAQSNRKYACGADHGTNVASLVAGISYGAGKNATIIPVAVQPGCSMSGTVSDLAQGLAWILDDMSVRPKPRPAAVVTMSLQLDRSDPSSIIIDSLVQDLISEGLIVVAAAGNYYADACNFSPSGLDSVITVGALDANQAWTSSNYGNCVDVWAPGVEIIGASPDCFRCTSAFTGTSQAAPIVTGLITTFLETQPTADIPTIKEWLNDNAITLDDLPANVTLKAAKYSRTYRFY